MKSKVLLLSLPGVGIYQGQPFFPMGIGYLLSSIKQDREAEACHWRYLPGIDEFVARVRYSNANIVGFTCSSFNRANVKMAANVVRQAFPEKKIVLGGVHPSFLPEQTLRNYPVDYIVISEGEITLRELCDAIDGNRSIESVDGIAYLKDGVFIQNKPREVMKNLDDLPAPDLSYVYNLMKSIDMGFVISSRGCPARCNFCSTGAYWGQKVRMNSVNRVVDEIETILNATGVSRFFFHDDTFNLGTQRAIDISNEIMRRGLKFEWAASCRVKPVSEEMIETMIAAGCRAICWGVESGSEEMLTKINKKITTDEIRNAFKLCEKHYNVMSTGAFTMVGNPGESEQTIQETVDFFNSIKLTDAPSTDVLMVLPGTKIYNDLLVTNPGLEEFWIKSDGVMHYTAENSIETLRGWQGRVVGSGQRLPKETPYFWRGII